MQSAQVAQNRLWVQLTAHGLSVWILTLRLAADSDRTALIAAVATFLGDPECDDDAIVNAVNVTWQVNADGDTIH